MERRLRRRLLILATVWVLFACCLTAIGWRLAGWHREGWIGASTFITMKPPSKKSPRLFKPGAVLAVYRSSPADFAGIKPGDEIVSINGVCACDGKAVAPVLLQTRIGQTLLFEVRRQERTFTVPVKLDSPFKSITVLASSIGSFLSGMLFLAVGSVVYWKRPDDRRALVFFLLAVAGAMAMFMGPVVGLESQDGRFTLRLFDQPWRLGILLGFIVLCGFSVPLLLLHFSLVFPRGRPSIRQGHTVLHWTYGIVVLYFVVFGVLFGLAAGGKMLKSLGVERLFDVMVLVLAVGLAIILVLRCRRRVRLLGWRRGLISGPYSMLLLYVCLVVIAAGVSEMLIQNLGTLPRFVKSVPFVLGIVFGLTPLLAFLSYPLITCVNLFRSYRESGVEEKRQIKWPLWGIGFGVGSQFALGIVGLGFGAAGIIWGQIGERAATFAAISDVISKPLYAAIPISMAFGILKYRLMDIDVLIKKTLIYSIVTGIILGIYLLLVGGVGGALLTWFEVRSQWVIMGATLAVAAVFVPVRRKVQTLVDRRFYRTRHEYPHALHLLNREFSHAARVEELLTAAAEHLQQALQARTVVVLLRPPGGQGLVAKAKVGLPDEVLDARLESSTAFAALDEIAEPHALELSYDDRSNLRRMGAVLLAPVKVQSNVLGLISLGSKLSDQDYNLEDREFVSEASMALAVRLEGMQLRGHEQEIQQAREIQANLLPKEIAQIAGYSIAGAWQPARIVSGDYYDVLKFSDTKVGLCIGDVAGKGMPAALLMSNLQAVVKAFATETMFPHELCEKINRLLCGNIAPGRFVTFFYGLLDAGTRTLSFTRAGHNFPILVRPDGSWTCLEAGGGALGIAKDWTFGQAEITLSKGDRLVLYTDGLSETTDAAGEEFGDARLVDLCVRHRQLSAADLQQTLLAAVTDFSNGHFHDDATMIVLGVEE